MNINKLALLLCKKEGLKKQVNIAQMKEILAHLSDMFYENSTKGRIQIYTTLYKNGMRRAFEEAKKKLKFRKR